MVINWDKLSERERKRYQEAWNLGRYGHKDGLDAAINATRKKSSSNDSGGALQTLGLVAALVGAVVGEVADIPSGQSEFSADGRALLDSINK